MHATDLLPIFFGIEMKRGGWDVFCSRECCAKVHPGEQPEMFKLDSFYDATGRNAKDATCFNCGRFVSR